jgi:hypothetical protein
MNIGPTTEPSRLLTREHFKTGYTEKWGAKGATLTKENAFLRTEGAFHSSIDWPKQPSRPIQGISR